MSCLRPSYFPQKPVGEVHSQFSTGHANSPCTIIIGKAHTEKVHVPARPYRMLNNFISNQKMDFKEDLSGKNIALDIINLLTLLFFTVLMFVLLTMFICCERDYKKRLSHLSGVLVFREDKAGLACKDKSLLIFGITCPA